MLEILGNNIFNVRKKKKYGGTDEVLSGCVLLTCAQPCQGPQCFRSMGMVRPSSGQAQVRLHTCAEIIDCSFHLTAT